MTSRRLDPAINSIRINNTNRNNDDNNNIKKNNHINIIIVVIITINMLRNIGYSIFDVLALFTFWESVNEINMDWIFDNSDIL